MFISVTRFSSGFSDFDSMIFPVESLMTLPVLRHASVWKLSIQHAVSIFSSSKVAVTLDMFIIKDISGMWSQNIISVSSFSFHGTMLHEISTSDGVTAVSGSELPVLLTVISNI